jgi:hypothetical protein
MELEIQVRGNEESEKRNDFVSTEVSWREEKDWPGVSAKKLQQQLVCEQLNGSGSL